MKEFNKPIFCKNCKLSYALIMEEDEYNYSEFICKACNQPKRSKREDFVEGCIHEEDLQEYKDRQGCCFDPRCIICKQRCGALNTMET